MSKQPIAVRFARETAEHEMTILHDDGLYRHVRFRNPKTGNMWFELITTPGTLIFQGDGDGFTFQRVPDMFEFFRGPVDYVNPRYWWEKVTDGRDRAERYYSNLMKQHLREAVAEAIREDPELAPLKDQVERELIGSYDIENEHAAVAAVMDFSFYKNDDDRYDPYANADFQFQDTYDWRVRDYDWWYLWACQAIVWGIRQYDAHAALPRPITNATSARLRKAVKLKCIPLAVAAPEPAAETTSEPAAPAAATAPASRPSGRFVDAPGYAFAQPIVEVQLPESTEVS